MTEARRSATLGLRGSVALRSGRLMFDMRSLHVAGLPPLAAVEQQALRLVAEGVSPREISEWLGLAEDALYRLVSWALDELEPAPGGRKMADVHAATGSRPATADDAAEFDRLYGASLPPDDEA